MSQNVLTSDDKQRRKRDGDKMLYIGIIYLSVRRGIKDQILDSPVGDHHKLNRFIHSDFFCNIIISLNYGVRRRAK